MDSKLKFHKQTKEESSKDSSNPNVPPQNLFTGSNTPERKKAKRNSIESYSEPTFGETRTSARPLQSQREQRFQNDKIVVENFSDSFKKSQIKATKVKLTMCSTIFLILPISFNGATISLLAYQFHLVGLALGAMVFLIAAILCVFAGFLIMETSAQVNASSYHQLAQMTIGKWSKERLCGRCVSTIAAILNCICLMGASVAGVVFNKNVASEAMTVLGSSNPNVPEMTKNPQFWAAIFIFGTVMPPLLFPRISCIKYISYFTSALSVLYLIVACWGLAVFEVPTVSDVQFFNFNFQNVQIAFTLFLYPLLFQPNIQTIFQEMEKPTVRRTTVTLAMDSLLVYVTYILIGVVGYLSFASSPQLRSQILLAQNIFKTKAYAQWIPNKIYSLLFLSTTLTLILSCLFPIKMVILECFKKKNSHSCKWNFIAAFILCFVLAGFSLAINKTSLAIRAIGVTCYPTMCFVLPALFYLSLDQGRTNCRNKTIKVFAWLLLLFVLGFIVSGVLDMVVSSKQ